MQKRILTVLIEQHGDAEHPAGAVEHTVTTILADQVRAEHELRMRRAGVEDAPIMFGAALAWAALAREGKTQLALDEFNAAVYDIERVAPEDAGVVDPTQPAASLDSASNWPSPTPAPDPTGGSPE